MKYLAVWAVVLLCSCGGNPPAADDGTQARALVFYKEGKMLEKDERTVPVAIESYTEAIRVWPEFADAYARRAALRERQGKLKEADADFNRAIELAPDTAIYYNNRALFYKTHGRTEEAERDFTHALSDPEKLGDQLVLVTMNRASLYWDMKKYDAAVKDFEEALRLGLDRDAQQKVRRYIQRIRDEQGQEGRTKGNR